MYDVYVWQREKTSKIVWKFSKVLNIRRRYTVSVKKKERNQKKSIYKGIWYCTVIVCLFIWNKFLETING